MGEELFKVSLLSLRILLMGQAAELSTLEWAKDSLLKKVGRCGSMALYINDAEGMVGFEAHYLASVSE